MFEYSRNMDEKDLSYSKKSIGGKKGTVTKYINHIKALKAQQNPSIVEIEETLAKLKLYFKQYESAFRTYQREYEMSGYESDIETEILEFSKYEDDYLVILMDTIAYVQRLKVLPNLPNPSPSGSNVPDPSVPCFKIKLPDLKLVEFDGNVEHWVKFRNTFMSLVDKRTDIDGVTKFAYLNQCLRGKAKDIISGFAGEDTDYKLALDALESYFADPKRIERTLIRNLLELKSPRYKKHELQDFKIQFETILRQIGTKRDVDASEWLIKEIIQSKLPVEAEKFIFSKIKSKHFSVQQMKDGLSDLIDFLGDNFEKNLNLQSNFKQVHITTNVPSKLNYSKSDTKEPFKDIGIYNCLFCDKTGHLNSDCRKYSNVQSRKERLREKKLCDKCCRRHEGNCTFVLKPCFLCNGSHHTYLCVRKLGPQISTSTTQQYISKGG